jgi:SAM-dependent methyltransferase
MRDSDHQKTLGDSVAGADAKARPADTGAYFASFYKSSAAVRAIGDRDTIGVVSLPEARFHYNATGNSIIRALAAIEPPPPGRMVMAWEMLRARSPRRLLDVGAATGHWIDFMREVYAVGPVVAVEFVAQMADQLRARYRDDAQVQVLQLDIADGLPPAARAEGFDYVTAIGVMFHIVDDARWAAAVGHLAAALKPGGVLLVGGEFGPATADRETVRTEHFATFRELSRAPDAAPVVTKRVRSLAAWTAPAQRLGLEVADLVRTDRDPRISTPENDLLVLRRPA